MSRYVDRHRGKRHSPNAVIAKFNRIRVRRPETLFLFLEGLLDRTLYAEAVAERFDGVYIESVGCDGKFGVLAMLDYVRRQCGGWANSLFFVDRDFEDFLPQQSRQDQFLYKTDGYSFENYFCSREAFRCVLRSVLHVDADDAVINGYVNRFQRAFEQFVELIRPLMAWTIVVKQLGGTVNLGNIQLRRIFQVDAMSGTPSRRSNALADYSAQAGANMSLLNLRTIRPVIRKLRALNPHRYVRGKYALWFFLRNIEAVKATLRAQHIAGERAAFIDAAIDENTLVQLIVRRLSYPPSLIRFLQHALATYRNGGPATDYRTSRFSYQVRNVLGHCRKFWIKIWAAVRHI